MNAKDILMTTRVRYRETAYSLVAFGELQIQMHLP